ncbi:MAG: hypothetical protein ACOCQD_01515 [archaeon]
MKTKMLNGKEYKIKPLDFNGICELEDRGVNLSDEEAFMKRGMNTTRTMLALILDLKDVEAGKLISEHVKNGGAMEDINEVINISLEEGGFLAQKVEKELQK